MRSPLSAAIAVTAVLALSLSACGSGPGQSGGSSPGRSEPAKQAEEPAEFAQVDAALVSGLVPTSYVDDSRGIHANVPVVTSARQMTSALDVLRARGLREAAWDQATKVDIGYQVVSSGPGVLGMVVTPSWTSGAGEVTKPALVWYDATTKRVFSSPVVIRESSWAPFTDEVVKAAGKKLDAAKIRTALADAPAPQGTGPMLGFDAKGNLIAKFAPGVVANEAVGVRVPATTVAPLLSEYGRRAADSSQAPTGFDGTPPPGAVEDAPASPAPGSSASAQPAATAGSSATPAGSAGSAKPAGTAGAGGTVSPGVAQRPSTAVGPDCTQIACVALTYDDGPSAETTPQLLKSLLDAKAPATFFQLGKMIQADPAVAAQVASDGNEIGSHTFTHPDLKRQSAASLQKEIIGTADLMEKTFGHRPLLMRPPYGSHNKASDEVIRSSGAAIIQWSVDTNDWQTKNTSSTENAVLYGQGVRDGGAIVLMHDIHPSTVAAAPAILEGLQQRGVTLVTVSELSLNSSPGYQAGHAYCHMIGKPQTGFDCSG